MLNIQAIHDAIDAFVLKGGPESYHIDIPEQKPRGYLGMSALGEDCRRKTWYEFRKVAKTTFPARMLRLFRSGDIYEYRFIFLLRGIGFEIFEKDENGKQFKATDFGGHLSGSMDGVGKAPKKFWVKGAIPHPFLTEYKTANSDSFKRFVNGGVKKTSIKYWTQCQAYMGYNELEGCLFCVVNKDDEDLHFEWVPFDKYAFKRIVASAEDILSADAPPARIEFASPSFWKCKNSKFRCAFYEICFKNAAAIKSCRSCKFAVPAEEGEWECTKGGEYGEVCGKWKDVTKNV